MYIIDIPCRNAKNDIVVAVNLISSIYCICSRLALSYFKFNIGDFIV